MKRYIVSVKFKSTRQVYHYYTFIDNLMMGDYVIVKSSNGFGLAQVIEYITKPGNWPCYSYVIGSVDMDGLLFTLEEQISALEDTTSSKLCKPSSSDTEDEDEDDYDELLYDEISVIKNINMAV